MSAKTPRVSVLIPTYNRAALLCDALDSVFEQTYSDFEVIVVDDGSTDDTQARLAKYADRIRYVRSDHAGPARARNIGMAQARGDYVCYLDSDDLYYPHKLALQVDHLDRHPQTMMVYTEFSAFDDNGYWDEFHLKTYHKSAYRRAECSYSNIFSASRPLADNAVLRAAAAGNSNWLARSEYCGSIFDAYLNATIVFTNSMMFRRSLLPQVGLQDRYFGHFHDLEFALRLCKAGLVAFIDNPTYRLRYHPGQVSSRKGSGGQENAVKLQRDLLRVARRHVLEDPRYYESHRARADLLLAGLHRAAAVPLVAYGGQSAHRRKYYPRRARVYIERCRRHGDAASMLFLVSYLPALMKRLYFRLRDGWRRSTMRMRPA